MVRRCLKCEPLNLVDTPAGLRAFPRDLKQKRPDLFIIGWHVDLAAATSTWHVLLVLMSWCRLHEIHLNILTSLSDILTTKAFPLPHIFKHVWARRSSDSVVSARLNSQAKLSLTWNHSHEVAAVSCLVTSWFDSCLATSREVKKSYRLCCICREVATFSLEQPYSCHLTHTLKVSKACQIHSIMRCLHILSQMDLHGSVCQMSQFLHASGNICTRYGLDTELTPTSLVQNMHLQVLRNIFFACFTVATLRRPVERTEKHEGILLVTRDSTKHCWQHLVFFWLHEESIWGCTCFHKWTCSS